MNIELIMIVAMLFVGNHLMCSNMNKYASSIKRCLEILKNYISLGTSPAIPTDDLVLVTTISKKSISFLVFYVITLIINSVFLYNITIGAEHVDVSFLSSLMMVAAVFNAKVIVDYLSIRGKISTINKISTQYYESGKNITKE